MSELSESQIREYANSCDLEKLHLQYQMTSNVRPDLINHNGYYHNFIVFKRNNFLQENKIDSIPLNDIFEEVFINELISINFYAYTVLIYRRETNRNENNLKIKNTYGETI
jgi:hypothetical protein